MSKISKKECIAMLLAGGQGTRLGVLTSSVAKPAVPFGAKYRIIDFPLSNSINSGIDTIGVLTQYRPFELHQYMATVNRGIWTDSAAVSTFCLRIWAQIRASGTRARRMQFTKT